MLQLMHLNNPFWMWWRGTWQPACCWDALSGSCTVGHVPSPFSVQDLVVVNPAWCKDPICAYPVDHAITHLWGTIILSWSCSDRVPKEELVDSHCMLHSLAFSFFPFSHFFFFYPPLFFLFFLPPFSCFAFFSFPLNTIKSVISSFNRIIVTYYKGNYFY